MAKKIKCTKGGYKEHRNPSLPARLGLPLLDKFPSDWYPIYSKQYNLNVSVYYG